MMPNKHFQGLLLSLLLLSGAVFANDISILSKPISAQVSVTGNMDGDKFAKLMRQDFQSVIVNRPDEESGNIITAAALKQIADQHNIRFIYQPVISGQISEKDIQTFAEYYNNLPKPILMVCRSGSRSTQLYQAAKQQGLLNE